MNFLLVTDNCWKWLDQIYQLVFVPVQREIALLSFHQKIGEKTWNDDIAVNPE